MPKKPYPSQIAPKPSRRAGKAVIPKPAYGMGSTPEQRKMARMAMTKDMKKRNMLRNGK
jgi:hypothetical protein